VGTRTSRVKKESLRELMKNGGLGVYDIDWMKETASNRMGCGGTGNRVLAIKYGGNKEEEMRQVSSGR
jgi:hypothetical protein